jgi:hypothetical protein
MSTYDLHELLRRWARGELSAEQAIGHLLQHLTNLANRLAESEQRIRKLEEVLNSKR